MLLKIACGLRWARNNRIMVADFLNQILNQFCTFGARLESILLGATFKNRSSTAPTPSRHLMMKFQAVGIVPRSITSYSRESRLRDWTRGARQAGQSLRTVQFGTATPASERMCVKQSFRGGKLDVSHRVAHSSN